MSLKGLFATDRLNARRGEVFAERRDHWRRFGVRHHADHAQVEPFAPELIARMFDSGVRIVGPVREYAYRDEEHGQTVRLNVETWHWYACDGTAEGRGLYELWAWRFDVSVAWACAAMFVAAQAANTKPARRKAAAA